VVSCPRAIPAAREWLAPARSLAEYLVWFRGFSRLRPRQHRERRRATAVQGPDARPLAPAANDTEAPCRIRARSITGRCDLQATGRAMHGVCLWADIGRAMPCAGAARPTGLASPVDVRLRACRRGMGSLCRDDPHGIVGHVTRSRVCRSLSLTPPIRRCCCCRLDLLDVGTDWRFSRGVTAGGRPNYRWKGGADSGSGGGD